MMSFQMKHSNQAKPQSVSQEKAKNNYLYKKVFVALL